MRPEFEPRPTRLFVLALAILAPACSLEKDREAVVASARHPCFGLTPTLCLSYVEDGGEPESIFGFEGFTHRWGVETRVRYHIERVEDPPADGSDRRWIVDEILGETFDDVGTQYTLSFGEAAPDSGWFIAYGERLKVEDTEVACAAELCAAVLAHTAAGTPFSATFELTADEDVPLRLLAVKDK